MNCALTTPVIPRMCFRLSTEAPWAAGLAPVASPAFTRPAHGDRTVAALRGLWSIPA